MRDRRWAAGVGLACILILPAGGLLLGGTAVPAQTTTVTRTPPYDWGCMTIGATSCIEWSRAKEGTLDEARTPGVGLIFTGIPSVRVSSTAGIFVDVPEKARLTVTLRAHGLDATGLTEYWAGLCVTRSGHAPDPESCAPESASGRGTDPLTLRWTWTVDEGSWQVGVGYYGYLVPALFVGGYSSLFIDSIAYGLAPFPTPTPTVTASPTPTVTASPTPSGG